MSRIRFVAWLCALVPLGAQLGCSSSTSTEAPSEEGEQGPPEIDPDSPAALDPEFARSGQSGDEGNQTWLPCLSEEQLVYLATVESSSEGCAWYSIEEPLTAAARESSFSPSDLVGGQFIGYFTAEPPGVGEPALVLISPGLVTGDHAVLGVGFDGDFVEVRWSLEDPPVTVDDLLSPTCCEEIYSCGDEYRIDTDGDQLSGSESGDDDSGVGPTGGPVEVDNDDMTTLPPSSCPAPAR